MAEAVSLASSLIALVLFALQSGEALINEIQEYTNQPRKVRDLKEELESITDVLQTLRDTIDASPAELSELKRPLLRCGRACNDLKELITKVVKNSKDESSSLRAWARLKYMNNDIVGFKGMIAGYKATIAVALGGANLRATKVTSQVLEDYHKLAVQTISDLQEHLQEMSENIQLLTMGNIQLSSEASIERERMTDEMKSTEQCIRICSDVSMHIQTARQTLLDSNNSPAEEPQESRIRPNYVYSNTFATASLQRTKNQVDDILAQLKAHLQGIGGRMESNTGPTHGERSPSAEREQRRMLDEIDSARQCLNICIDQAEQASRIRINVFEDVTMDDDGQQIVASTLGDLISAKRIKAGARSAQWLGQWSDETMQVLSNNHKSSGVRSDSRPDIQSGTVFEGRFGTGRMLNTPRPKE